MRPIPPKLRRQFEQDPYMYKCIRRDEGDCMGRIEWHHALFYGRKQLNERFAIVPACTFHHRGAGKNDEKFRLVAYQCMTDDDWQRFPKARERWAQEYKYLKGKYEQ